MYIIKMIYNVLLINKRRLWLACRELLGNLETRKHWLDSRSLELHFKDVRASCFCASLLRTTARANSYATSCIRQMAIAIAFLGFNDLGRSVTPTFLFRNRFYLQLSPHCSKMKKNQSEKLKKIQDFCLRDMESSHFVAARCVKLWSLNANLVFEEPHQLTKFT